MLLKTQYLNYCLNEREIFFDKATATNSLLSSVQARSTPGARLKQMQVQTLLRSLS